MELQVYTARNIQNDKMVTGADLANAIIGPPATYIPDLVHPWIPYLFWCWSHTYIMMNYFQNPLPSYFVCLMTRCPKLQGVNVEKTSSNWCRIFDSLLLRLKTYFKSDDHWLDCVCIKFSKWWNYSNYSNSQSSKSIKLFVSSQLNWTGESRMLVILMRLMIGLVVISI